MSNRLLKSIEMALPGTVWPATRGGSMTSGEEAHPDARTMSDADAATMREDVRVMMRGITDQHSPAGRAPSRIRFTRAVPRCIGIRPDGGLCLARRLAGVLPKLT